MSTPDVDVCVVGAGMSGLSAAVHILRHAPQSRVVLVDPRVEWGDDRTWCFFDVDTHPFMGCVTDRWSRWLVAEGKRFVERRATGVRYVRIPSRRFYDHARAVIDDAEHARIDAGVTVESVVASDEFVEVETSSGRIRARCVLDSRPPDSMLPPGASQPAEPALLQHFVGAEVRTDRPVFEPDCATLMDFRGAQTHGLGFVYVLPFAEDRALVEPTWFTPATFARETYQTRLHEALERRLSCDYEVLHTEQGVIPMTTARFPSRPARRHIRIGLAGGFARPATGYAFLGTQRWCDAFATRVAHAGLDGALDSIPAVRPFWLHNADRVFLSWLEANPDRAPSLFTTLFERVEPAALVRFLSDVGSPLDLLRVMWACPALEFTGEVATVASRQFRMRVG